VRDSFSSLRRLASGLGISTSELIARAKRIEG
jgi:DNA-binding Lrp family transcriptional regulator